MLKMLSDIADRVSEAVRKIPDTKCRGEEICMGADGTPTTQVDKIAENTILRYIEENGIRLNVLSEEIGLVDNGADDTLVIDPIDGTKNCIMGAPMYTVSMAVGKNSIRDIHTAYLRNIATGDTYTAEKGKGAFKNGQRINVIEESDPKKLMMMIYLGNGAHPDSFALAKKVHRSRAFGCASLEMALVAEGAADGFMMNAENQKRSIRVIDIAASYLILKEAGGEVFALDGTPLDMPFDLDYRANFLAVGDRCVFDMVMGSACVAEWKPKMRYGVYVNMSIPSVISVAEKVIAALGDETIILDTGIAEALGKKGVPVDEMDVDVMVAVGGDGTILRALQNNNAMIIGVNAGGVGFLTEVDIDSIEEGIARLRRGEYIVEKRFKLRTKFDGAYLEDAVNEAVIHTDSIAKIRQFKVYVDGKLATDLRADGLIISTPTGTTSYAMSLGAPIIDPKVNAIALVPMAAFKFTAKPIIVPTTSKVTVELTLDKGCVLVIDGQKEHSIPGMSKVEFMMSTNYARFITFNPDVYTRIQEKLVKVL